MAWLPDGIDIVVVPVVLVFPEFFFFSAQRLNEDGGALIFATKWTFRAIKKFCGGDRGGYHY